VTTGVPIYLVSACTSAEEFIAAFRRYADRGGLFVPLSEPLPAGKVGRFALTLVDGGVMIEGEAQIITSSTKAQGMHGRPGMTIKFTDLDGISKIALGELEKARLAMKPAPPSVVPRPAQIPASPRPVAPARGGRIDSANALAQCVVIGDVSTLREGEPPKAGQKFVVPAIPTIVGGPGSGPAPRAKTPTAPPPSDTPRAKTPTAPPPSDTPRAKTPTAPPEIAQSRTKTLTAPPPIDPSKAGEPPAAPPPEPRAKTPTAPPSDARPVKSSKPTRLGMPIVDKLPLDKLTATPHVGKPTAMGMGPLKVTQTQPLPIASAPSSGDDSSRMLVPAPLPRRAHTPSSGPPLPRTATPVAPLPIVRAPAASASAVEVATEQTDITTKPEPALDTSPLPMMTPDDSGSAYVGPPPTATDVRAGRSGGMRASEIMAAIPTDDWTMSPDQSGPVVLQPNEKLPTPLVVAGKQPAKGPPTGDWTMQADPEAPGGWSPPAKVAAEDVAGKPATGNPVVTVASDKPIAVQVWEDKPTGIGEPLVEIDSTLMEPLKPMPVDPDAQPTTNERPISPPAGPTTGPSPLAPQPSSQMFATPAGEPVPPTLAAMFPARANTQPPFGAQSTQHPRMDGTGASWFRDSEQVPRYPTGDQSAIVADQQKRKKLLLISVGSAVGVVMVVLIIVLAMGGKKKPAAANKPSNGSSTVVMSAGSSADSGSAMVAETGSGSAAGSGSAIAMVEPAGSGSGSAAPAPEGCSVEVTTNPPGAQVTIDKDVLGTTPGTFQLPCGAPAKLSIKKAGFFSATKDVTPGTDSKVAIELAKAMFSIKVTSAPAGASITVGGKAAGVTPTTIKVPAFAQTTITLTKDGYAPDTQKIAPRQNNAAHHVNLKRGPPKHR
jgi:hypothetical protein